MGTLTIKETRRPGVWGQGRGLEMIIVGKSGRIRQDLGSETPPNTWLLQQILPGETPRVMTGHDLPLFSTHTTASRTSSIHMLELLL